MARSQRAPVDRVVSIVGKQTSKKQPDTVPEHIVVRLLIQRRRDRDTGGWTTQVSASDAREAIADAVEQGRIEAVEEDGETRYRLVDEEER